MLTIGLLGTEMFSISLGLRLPHTRLTLNVVYRYGYLQNLAVFLIHNIKMSFQQYPS